MIQPERVRLLIADISGYTEYLAGVEIDHATDILADLIGTVVTSLRPTFRLAKLEGDAAFCFAPADEVDGSTILDTIERTYFTFRRRRRDVRQATTCRCDACSLIPTLNLKFVAHHGLAVRQEVAGSEELLGSDVILVHRLLKNAIVERTMVSAYAAISDSLATDTGLDPLALGMVRHKESYEHVGEVTIWVHDLERRWQDEEARTRVFIGPEDARFETSEDVSAPPQIVWDYLTKPGQRMTWQRLGGVTSIEQDMKPGGRRGVGMVNHCMHGPDAIVEEILDWRPFDYLTDRSTLPGGAFSMVSTFELEPTPAGTKVHFRIGPAEAGVDPQMLGQYGAQIAASLSEGLRILKAEAETAASNRPAEASEPALPVRRAADGFLAGVPAIEYVD